MSQRICFPFVGDSVGGSQISAAALIAALRGSRYDPHVVLHQRGPLMEYLDECGLAFEVLPLDTFVGSGRSMTAHIAAALRTAPRLAAFLRRHGTALVHTQDGRMNQTWGLPARLTATRFVWHQRSMYAPSRLTKTMMQLADAILCNSSFVCDGLPSSVRERATVVANPVTRDPTSADREKARNACLRAVGADDDAHLLAFVGNLTRQKRPEDFISTAALIAADAARSHHFLIFGRDRESLRPELEQQARKHGIADRLHFMGFRGPIQEWLAGVDLLLAPQVDDAFGRTLVEAMLVGTPVIATDTGGHRDIVRDRETGRLTPADDPTAMAAAAIDLLRDEPSFRRLADAGRRWADGRFSVEAHTETVMAIYDRLLARQ